MLLVRPWQDRNIAVLVTTTSVVLEEFESPTIRLAGGRSDQLSYRTLSERTDCYLPYLREHAGCMSGPHDALHLSYLSDTSFAFLD